MLLIGVGTCDENLLFLKYSDRNMFFRLFNT
jgi:hypothetical protein